jgi:8-oxo-dGTP pyrophosphatase MutT (NUDIX family)
MPPVTPRPAASVILLRRGRHQHAPARRGDVRRHASVSAERALEVLMVKRNPEASFMPGVWVFPGGAVAAADGEGEEGFRACAVRELAEEAGIELEVGSLHSYSRWITPEMVPVRFDTWFFLALAPTHSPPRPDGAETVAAGWFEPRAALEAHSAGELELVFPTIRHLESLLPYETSTQALEAVAGRRVEPVLPRVVGEGAERRVVLPGDPGYD